MTHRWDLVGALVLIAGGVILLLRNLGYLPPAVDQWWPVILILIGLAVVFNRGAGARVPEGAGGGPPAPKPAGMTEGRRRAPTGGLILIALGLALLADNLLGGRAAGPLLVIALGLAILVARLWWPPS